MTRKRTPKPPPELPLNPDQLKRRRLALEAEKARQAIVGQGQVEQLNPLRNETHAEAT